MEHQRQWLCLLVFVIVIGAVTTEEIIDCGSNYTINNGNVNFTENGTVVNGTATVTCDVGYKRQGESFIICRDDGTWSNETHCSLIDCGKAPDVDNGYVNLTEGNTTFNSTYPVSCKGGYEVQGDRHILCQSDGTWSRNVSCQAKGSGGPAYKGSIHLAIPIATGVIFAVGIVVCVVIFLYFRRWRKNCFPKLKEPPHFDELEMELKVWSKFRPSVVKLEDFSSYTDVLHKDNNKMFVEGFRLLNEQSPSHPATVGETDVNRSKSRYSNILPFDNSRVKLTPIDDIEGTDFINANYIPGYKSPKEYIATQTPLPETRTDFWRMIWEQNVDMIVMLTKRLETRKSSLPKNYSMDRHGICSTVDQYWPDRIQEPVYYGDLKINTLSESVLSGYITRVMEIKMGSERRTITQIHFIKWPDHGCPRKVWPFIHFVTMVRQYRMQQMVVHCSSGISQTGTFIALDRLLQHVRDHDDVDVYSVMLEMRNYRCNMVKTEEQFIFIYECLRHYITSEEDVEDDKDGVGEKGIQPQINREISISEDLKPNRPKFYSNRAYQEEGHG